MPVKCTPAQMPPAPGALSKPGSVGMLGNVDTATLGGGVAPPPVGGPNSATNGSTRPAFATVFDFTIGTGVVVIAGGVVIGCGATFTGPGGGGWLKHAATASDS